MSLDGQRGAGDPAPSPEGGGELARLREAYLDLESTRHLRELGRASAFINHEIKNHMMVVSGYASLLLRSKTISEKERAMVENIARTAATLQEFCVSVLEMSKTASSAEEFDLAAAIAASLDDDFAADRGKFSIERKLETGSLLVNGDRQKLIKAFACAFQNSLEAGAQNIRVTLSVCNYIAIIVIDDDGSGCDAEGVKNLAKTFFTSKRDSVGLGLCSMRSIIESHGGDVSIYSKNLLGGGARGFKAVVTLPASKRNPSAPMTAETLVVREEFGGAGGVLKILKNIKTIPRIVHSPKEAALSDRGETLKLIVFAAPSKSGELTQLANGNPAVKIVAVEEGEGGEGGSLFTCYNGYDRVILTEELAANYLSGGDVGVL